MNGVAKLVASAAVALLACALAADAVEPLGRGQTAQTAQPAQTAPPTRPVSPRAPAATPAAPAAPPAAAPPAPAPAAPPAANAPPAPAAQPPAPKPTRTEILNFDNWVVTCNEFAEGPKTRVCAALLQIAQQNTNQIVFAWTIAVDNSKQLVTIMQTPTGVNIPPGVELRVGKVPPHKIPFASCDAGRCVASLPMDAALLREMTTVPTAEAVIQGSQGNTVQFNIQMKGFDKAYGVLSRL